jgi:protein involved in polysaccharide export with SLBB domain
VKPIIGACSILSIALLASAAPQPAERVIVVGDRARATEIPYSGGLTASRAILAAGGYGDLSRTPMYLVGCGQLTHLDMRAVLELGQRDKDVQLKPWDVIVIGTNLSQHR